MGQLNFLIRCSLIGAFFIFSKATFAQVYQKNIADYILKVENPYVFLQRIEKLGIKEVGTKSLDSTQKWLVKSVEQLGYTCYSQPFAYNLDTLRNIEFVKRGDSDSCIIIGAHYDGINGPGVNDNGSGNFALYQMAKWIKNLKSKYTLRFVYFSGEEIGYLGSKHYVKSLNKDSIKIKFMLNLDQLGGTIGEDNSGIKCERDEFSNKKVLSASLTSTLARYFSLYTNLNPIVTPAYLSDYLSFRDSGYVITGLYQYSAFPYYHTESDLLKHMDLVSLQSITKGALAFLLEQSETDVPVGISPLMPNADVLNVYCTDGGLFCTSNKPFGLKVYDQLGRQLILFSELNSDTFLPSNSFKPGIYYAYVFSGQNMVCKKFLVKP